MSKVVEATCESGVVKIGTMPIDSVILSQGSKPSTGKVLIDEDEVTYITSNASDISDLIVRLVAIVAKVGVILSAIDGATNSPGANAATILELTALKTQLNTTKDLLK